MTSSVDLTAARIRRANPSIGEGAARQMAAELYDIVECARKYCAAVRPSRDFDVDDFIRALTHRIVDDPSPPGSAAYKAAVADTAWLMRRFTALGGHAFYLRYMRLVDQVNGTDIVGKYGLGHKSPAKAKRPVPPGMGLTAARIYRANPSISEKAAREMSAELDDIIVCAIANARRQRRAAEPGFSADDESELVQVMTYAIIEDNSEESSAASDHEYLVGMLLDHDKEDFGDLYSRYMHLFDRISGTNMVGDFDLDGPPAKKRKPELCLVRDDIPSLDAIMQALIAAVRLAQSGKGPTKILDLLPAFKESVELDFIMKATEAHRGALFDLVQNAGIPVKKGDSK